MGIVQQVDGWQGCSHDTNRASDWRRDARWQQLWYRPFLLQAMSCLSWRTQWGLRRSRSLIWGSLATEVTGPGSCWRSWGTSEERCPSKTSGRHADTCFSTCFVDAVKLKNRKDETIVWQLRDALGAKALLFSFLQQTNFYKFTCWCQTWYSTSFWSELLKTKPGIKKTNSQPSLILTFVSVCVSQPDDQHHTEWHHQHAAVAQHGEVLERSARHLCDAQTGGGAPEERPVQETTNHRYLHRCSKNLLTLLQTWRQALRSPGFSCRVLSRSWFANVGCDCVSLVSLSVDTMCLKWAPPKNKQAKLSKKWGTEPPTRDHPPGARVTTVHNF